MTLDTTRPKAMRKKKSSLKRNNETLDSEVLPTKKFKKDFTPKTNTNKKVHFDITEDQEPQGKKKQTVSALKKKFPDKNKANKVKKFSGKKVVKIEKEKSQMTVFKTKKRQAAKEGPLKNNNQKKFENKHKKEFSKVKAPKQLKLTRVEQRLLRKQTKNNFELSMKLKRLWEIIRCNETRKGKCDKLCEELHNLIKGKASSLIYAHDTSRVIECLVALGSEAIRNDLFEELKGELIKISKSKYAKFFVMKLLKYGSTGQRNTIITSFYGNVVNLMNHSEAASVIEYAYNEFAKPNQRAKLTEEFYGPSYRIFKDGEISSLSRLLSEDPSRKQSILSYMKENLIPMTQKSVIKHSLIHHVLNEYITHCEESDRTEMIEALREFVIFFLHTKDGSRVAMQCLWHGTAKDRKIIIKSFKTHVTKICKEEHGHWVLLATFDCIDDTILVNKIILSEVIKDLEEIILDRYGRKIIMYLLSPRDPIHCHGDVIKILEQGDQNIHSKKEKAVRCKELLTRISEPLLTFLAENARKMIFTSSSNIVAQLILKHAIGDFSNVYQSITNLVAEPFTPGISENPHIIEHTAGHLFLKLLLTLDKEKANDQDTFCSFLMKTISQNSYKEWINSNRGAFVLVRILETEKKEVVDFYKRILIPLKKQLKEKKELIGANILMKKL